MDSLSRFKYFVYTCDFTINISNFNLIAELQTKIFNHLLRTAIWMSNLKIKYSKEIFPFFSLSKSIHILSLFPYHQTVHLPSTSNPNPAVIFDSSLLFIFTTIKFCLWWSKWVTNSYHLHSYYLHWNHQVILPKICQVFTTSLSSFNPASGLGKFHFILQEYTPLSFTRPCALKCSSAFLVHLD